MKRLSLIIGKIAVIGLLAMMPIMVSAVQYKNTYQPVGAFNQGGAQFRATAPSATFQSTSAMQGSGSAYSSNPMLNSNGIATLDGSETPAQAPSGPRKASVFDDDDEDMPIGDAVLPLLLLAGMYLIIRVARRRARKEEQ